MSVGNTVVKEFDLASVQSGKVCGTKIYYVILISLICKITLHASLPKKGYIPGHYCSIMYPFSRTGPYMCNSFAIYTIYTNLLDNFSKNYL